jgi:hypothetical protein
VGTPTNSSVGLRKAAGSGTVSGANVSSIQVTCATNKCTISGAVSGLRTGAQVIVQNNAGNSTTVKTNGLFSFRAPILYSGSYAVSVLIQPPAQACTVSAGSGSGVTANVTGVTVTCGPAAESVLLQRSNRSLPVDFDVFFAAAIGD